MKKPEPTITRAIGRAKRTPLQRQRYFRDLAIAAAYVRGCSVRLLAEGHALDPKRVRTIVTRLSLLFEASKR